LSLFSYYYGLHKAKCQESAAAFKIAWIIPHQKGDMVYFTFPLFDKFRKLYHRRGKGI